MQNLREPRAVFSLRASLPAYSFVGGCLGLLSLYFQVCVLPVCETPAPCEQPARVRRVPKAEGGAGEGGRHAEELSYILTLACIIDSLFVVPCATAASPDAHIPPPGAHSASYRA